uniref:Synaptotagmin VIIa n=1 Tax=Poecilia latipinna TaxID=48699 RepID=A0A3B3U7T1_9TELE
MAAHQLLASMDPDTSKHSSLSSVSLSVFLVSLAVTVCAVWLVALCGVCGWCQRKLVSLRTNTSKSFKSTLGRYCEKKAQ